MRGPERNSCTLDPAIEFLVLSAVICDGAAEVFEGMYIRQVGTYH